VALRAVCRAESCSSGRVHRIVGLLPGWQVATRIATIGRSNLQVVVVIDVALGTGDGGVRVRERKTGHAVVEGDIGPGSRVVTGGAIRRRERWACSGVGWVICLLPSCQVAASVSAIGRGDL